MKSENIIENIDLINNDFELYRRYTEERLTYYLHKVLKEHDNVLNFSYDDYLTYPFQSGNIIKFEYKKDDTEKYHITLLEKDYYDDSTKEYVYKCNEIVGFISQKTEFIKNIIKKLEKNKTF